MGICTAPMQTYNDRLEPPQVDAYNVSLTNTTVILASALSSNIYKCKASTHSRKEFSHIDEIDTCHHPPFPPEKME